MHLKPRSFLKTVTDTGIREQVTTSDIKVVNATIQADLDNTGIIYIGDSQVSSTNYSYGLLGGDSVTLAAVNLGQGIAMISLRDIWADTSSDGDQLLVGYLQGEN